MISWPGINCYPSPTQISENKFINYDKINTNLSVKHCDMTDESDLGLKVYGILYVLNIGLEIFGRLPFAILKINNNRNA